MHHNRTWTLDPPEWRTQRNRLLPIEGGDGSTLNLDFTTGVLDPRITFSRLSTATFVNSSGYVEHAGANLLLQGSNLGSASWTALALTSRNASTDPNGSNQAVELSEDATTSGHIVLQVTPQNLNGLIYTASVYMKAGTNRTIGFIRDNNVSSDAVVFYTLTGSGSTTIANGSWGIVPSITRVGTTDWYHCVFTIKAAGSANIQIGTANGTAYGNWSFAGTVGNSIHVWGAQINLGSTAQTYYPTTTEAYYAPRFEYDPTTLVAKGLLLEGASTNLSTYSEDFSNAAWTKSGIAQTATAGTSPTNNNTATLIAENAGGFIKHSLERSITVTAGSIYTFSVFLKEPTSNSRRYACIQVADGSGTALRNTIVVDLQTGTVTASGVTGAVTNASHNIIKYPNGWYRVSISMTYVASPCYPTVILSDIATLYGGANQPFYTAAAPYKGLLVYGAQVELGLGASSYIPVGASAVARTEDRAYISGTNFSSWFTGGSTGTLLVEYYRSEKGSTAALPRTILATREAANQHFHLKHNTSETTVVLADSAADKATASSLYSGRNRTAFTYNGASNAVVRLVTNGETITTAVTSNTTPANATHLTLGYPSITLPTTSNAAAHLNSAISKIKYYPTVLADNVLQEITSANYVAPTFDIDFTTMSTGADLTAKGLTFSRLGNATFINSQGYVEYAGANMFPNSAFNDANPTPSGWNAFGFSATATITIPSDTEARKISTTSVSEQPFIHVAPTVVQGLVYTASIQILEVTDPTAQSMSYAQCLSAPFASSAIYYMNGQSKGTGTGIITGETGILSVVYTAGASSQIRIGFVNNSKTNCSVTFKAPQHEQGAVINRSVFYRRTAVEGAYYAPRFDYDPVLIGTPRGLLIESSTTNQVIYSEDFTKSAFWQPDTSGGAVPTVTTVTNATTPANTLSVNQVVFNKTGGVYSRISNSAIGIASQPYTMSVWMRTVTGTANVGLRIGGDPAGFNCPVSTTWKRFQYTYTPANTDVNAQIMLWDNIVGNDETATVYVWGCQLEAGSGASSYIPTGVSTVLRNPDNCYIYDATTSGSLSWLKTATQGTFYVEAHKRTAGTTFAGALYGTLATATQDFMLYQAIGNNWLSFNWGSDNITNYSAPASPRVLKSAVALSPSIPISKANNAVSVNGSSPTLNTSSNITLPFASNLFCIGSKGANSGTVSSTNYADSSIKKLSFYPAVLTNTQLQTLTLPTLISPTLDLNFLSMSTHADLTANGLTFNRTTAATFINSSGYVAYADANLIVSSEAIEVGSGKWTVVGTASVATDNTVANPNGIYGVTKVIGTTTGSHRIVSNAIQMNRQPHTLTLWVRAGTSLLTNIGIYDGTNWCPYTATVVSGTATLIAGTNQLSIGGLTTTWTKIQIVLTPITDNPFNILFYPDNNGTSKDVYLWGVQVNPGVTAQTYYPTTTTAYHGPRFDYSPTNIGEPRGLLIEGQAVNILKYSNAFTSGDWYLGGTPAILTPNYAIGPDGVTGSAWRFQGTTNNSVFATPVSNGGAAHLVSIYAKSNTGSNQTFTIHNGSTTPIYTATNVWQRFQVSVAGSWSYAYFGTYGLNQDILIWGAQSELGTYGATSYIPTGASTVTRFPDLLAVTNLTTMKLNTNEGTFFVETELPRGGTTSPAQFGAPYTNGSWFGHFYGAADATTLTANFWGGSLGGLVRSGNTKSLTALSYGAYTGLALPFSSSLNGALSTGTMTSSGGNNAPNPATWSYITLACNTSSLATTARDNLNACIKSFRYYPVRLTDAQLQSITA